MGKKYKIKILYIFIIIVEIFYQTNININNFCKENYCPAYAFSINNNYIKYTGEIEHLVFRTLMAFPEKALSPDNHLSSTYDETKLTINEFKNILEQLYKNNYILIDIYELLDTSLDYITLNDLYLPPNKKPIILSFDNVTYKSNYQNLGEIDKIIVDRNSKIATYTTKKSIQDRIQYDNEFIVILENFICSHPDFSFNNARGIIFFSGENGILGYNTNHKNTSSKFESKRATEVIIKLSQLGWRFGSNNFTYKLDSLKSDIEFAKELSLWQQDIEKIIGTTELYAHPYGIKDTDSTKQELLLSHSFKIFFENNYNNNLYIQDNYCYMNRKEVNGHTLRDNVQIFNGLFNPEEIYDYENRTTPFIKKEMPNLI